MKRFRKALILGTAIGILGGTSVFAANTLSPAEIAAQLTGKTSEELLEERAEGKTYGAIAKEVGKLEEFKEQMLEQKKQILDERVKEGLLTQEEADAMYEVMKENQEICDGTGSLGVGSQCRGGFGLGQMRGSGFGPRQNRGMRTGRELYR